MKAASATKKTFRLVETHVVANLTFSESLGGRKSAYREMLLEACQAGKIVNISDDDSYALTMFKLNAKKLRLRLTFAKDSGNLYIRAHRIEGELQRLFLLLREPRTFMELAGKKLELDLKSTLAEQTKSGNVRSDSRANIERFTLTEQGMKAITQ